MILEYLLDYFIPFCIMLVLFWRFSFAQLICSQLFSTGSPWQETISVRGLCALYRIYIFLKALQLHELTGSNFRMFIRLFNIFLCNVCIILEVLTSLS